MTMMRRDDDGPVVENPNGDTATHVVRGVFADSKSAESALGRIEVAGVPPESIQVLPRAIGSGDTILVRAVVDANHVEKVVGILSGEGADVTIEDDGPDDDADA